MKKIGVYTVNTQKILGQGSFATTCQAYLHNPNEQLIKYACKITEKKTFQNEKEHLEYLMKRVREQVKSWQTLQHPNIVRFIHFEQSKNNLYFFLELCEQGTLSKYIENHRFQKNFKECIKFSKELISAAYYLFQKGIIHRDIKPDNILLKSNELKLSDFGLARILDPQQAKNNTYTMTAVGTPIYMAPQVLKSQKYTIKCDVWSIGATIYELITGYLPYKVNKFDNSPIKIVEKVTTQKLDLSAPQFNKLPMEVTKMLTLMLQVDPHKRISIEQAYKIITSIQI